ncbi:MAG: hypothetical protein ACRCSD_09310 [Clostridium sp.]
MIAVKALQDYYSHWYLIPNELEEEFNILQEKLNSDIYEERYDDEDLFNIKFNHYRTDGDLNNIQLFVNE